MNAKNDNLIRKQCYFTRAQDRLIKDWSFKTGLNQAEIIRNAIGKYLGEEIMESKEELEKRILIKKKEKELLELQIKEMELKSELTSEKIQNNQKREWLND